MKVLRLVADDLTGAVDAAAPFARVDAPVAVLRDIARAGECAGAWAWDAATREGGADEASGKAQRAGALLRGAAIAFRKIDSLLRGHVATEIAATAQGGGFASAVIAPAFPTQGRVTRQGRQYARKADGAWNAVGGDLLQPLADLGMAPVLAAHPRDIAGKGVFLCDADSDADLAAIAAAGRRLAPPVLWCGSAGLARALAGATRCCALPTDPLLGVIGSRHPGAVAEVDRLRARRPSIVRLIGSWDGIADSVENATQMLNAARSVVLALRLPALPAAEAASALRHLARECTALRSSALFASGGDTLAALADAAGAARLDCLGEIMPGVPLSRMAGGCWNGVAVVSKSGGFAAGDVLMRLFDHEMEKKRAQA